MIRQLLVLTTCIYLAACADSHFSNKGMEALVYQERHQFTVEQKKQNSHQLNMQFNKILSQFKHELAATQWQLSYSHAGGKQAAQQLQSLLLQQGILANSIQLQQRQQVTGLLVVNTQVYKLLTEDCPVYVFDSHPLRQGCFIDAMRLKQVDNPKNLIR